jgi:hypothetical protein
MLPINLRKSASICVRYLIQEQAYRLCVVAFFLPLRKVETLPEFLHVEVLDDGPARGRDRVAQNRAAFTDDGEQSAKRSARLLLGSLRNVQLTFLQRVKRCCHNVKEAFGREIVAVKSG